MKILLAGLSALLLAAAAPAKIDALAWMAGSWVQEKEGRWTEEYWTVPRGGAMLGASRSGRADALREFEFLRIQPGKDGTLAYIAQPGGGAPVEFRLAQHDVTSATFENPAHDYPQRIRYARDGDVMTATISAIDGSKAMSWVYTRR
ncbi:DUF6265 family protein [Sphingopyxis sp. BSN-002]|uniref:DUF6265 family protein n=1 Tax=Sphingopyxis sp. BSN-002 TaxID=2911495 RepID=UPI001EDA01E4|nr:DUF6265 family protein [Sphingopyxis sp. BSN-002]UKK83314.1 DUF6265 family protein [Sphingopyxis sp. BSN-002]